MQHQEHDPNVGQNCIRCGNWSSKVSTDLCANCYQALHLRDFQTFRRMRIVLEDENNRVRGVDIDVSARDLELPVRDFFTRYLHPALLALGIGGTQPPGGAKAA